MRTKNIDIKLIILQVLHNLWQKNTTIEIRRARLKETSEDYLWKEHQVDAIGGGTFQRSLEKLEVLGLVKIISKGKKETIIVSNIKRIEYFLQNKEIKASLDKSGKLIQENVEDSILEEIMEETFTSRLDIAVGVKYNSIPGQSYYILREFISKLLANVMSRSFEINVSYPEDTNFQMDREFIITIVNPILEMVKRNVRAPFTVNFEYKGRPESSEFFRYEPAGYSRNSEYFGKWVKEVYEHDVSQEDKKNVNEGQIHLLSKSASQYYDIFTKSAQDYLNLLSI